MRKLYQFHGGVHPPSNKAQSAGQPIKVAAMPERLVIPFNQHVGNMAKPLVKPGDYVLKGQLIGMPQDGISSAIHASTSGTIQSIDMQVIAHASGLPDLCAILIPDGKDEWMMHQGMDYEHASAADIRLALRLAGVVGLGGAAFPSDLKLKSKTAIHTLILNGVECEPYITCDDMLMRERAEEIVRGALILKQVLQAETVIVAIEDNKPQAVAAMRRAVQELSLNFEVVAVPTVYPTGGSKQLIKVLTNIEVASSPRTTDFGVQCFNVATVRTVYRALALGEPLLSRLVTVTGNVKQAANFEVLVGTSVADLVQQAEPLDDTTGYIMGGPMMGLPLPSAKVSLVKASNCIIAASDKLFPPPDATMPCIRCTRCAEVCQPSCSHRICTGLPNPKNLIRHKNTTCLIVLNAVPAVMFAPVKFP